MNVTARHRNAVIAAVLLMTALSSCGYHLSGRGSLVPAGMSTIAVPMFVNGTNEPYADVELTRALVNEFIADGRLRVVDVEVAELALRGTVTRFELTALSYTAASFVQQYKVRLVVNARLEDVQSRKVLWQEQGIESVFIADYAVTVGDIRLTKAAKEDALKRASQDVAWTLRSRVLEGF